MKKLASIGLVFLLLLNSFGYFFIFSYNQESVRNEMRTLIHSGYFRNHYETLEITNPWSDPGFKWTEKGEFEYGGKLYDMISVEVKGTTTVFCCINDTGEEQLIARHEQFRDLLDGLNSPERTKTTRAMHDLVIKQALIGQNLFHSPESFSQVNFYDPVLALHPVALTPVSPPPRES